MHYEPEVLRCDITARLPLFSQPVRKRMMFVAHDLQEIVAGFRTGVYPESLGVLRVPQEREVFPTRGCGMSIEFGRTEAEMDIQL